MLYNLFMSKHLNKSRSEKILKNMRRKVFLSPSGSNSNVLIKLVKKSVKDAVKNQGNNPLYSSGINNRSALSQLSLLKIPHSYKRSHNDGVRISKYLRGSVIAHNPYVVKNIIPLPNFIYLATYVSCSLYMGNAVSGEDSGEALRKEPECAAYISNMIGLDPNNAAGIFTFGGSATNLYAIKIGITKIQKDSPLSGIKNNLVIIGNQASHYCQQSSATWLGIGQDNYMQVGTNADQTTNMVDFERACHKAIKDGKKIACMEAVGGTTSNMGIDDLEEFFDLRSRLIEKYKLDYVPHIHVDSVMGWAWLNFLEYDFEMNPLGFNNVVLKKIKHNTDKVSKFYLGDSFGIDFHKTGYTPYNSSMIIVKNKEDFNLLKRKKDVMTPLFHDDTEYNPGLFTLETSRSTANILATWATINNFGAEGFQVLIGHAVEMRETFIEGISKLNSAGIAIENIDGSCIDIYLRFITSGDDPQVEHAKEIYDEDTLNINSEYTNSFFEWYQGTFSEDKDVAFSKSNSSIYSQNGTPLVAIRIVLLGVNIKRKNVQAMIEYIIGLKSKFDELRNSLNNNF